MKGKTQDYFSNNMGVNKQPLVMYIDMNCYFASCEQQRNPAWRGKPLGVVTYNSYNPAVIAASIEAKQYGIKSGMRLRDCLNLCPHMLTTPTSPAWYRQVHVDIMAILRRYCDDVIPKSIDEAVCNFHSYALVYKDLGPLALQIKADIAAKYDWLKCSIGIAPNTYLAKLGTELQKPDGLEFITEENIDAQLGRMKLRDLTGIADKNEQRLLKIGIRSPVEMRHSSPSLLRKAFGGVVGDYWHKRLNFGEVDMYSRAENRTMSATRTMSSDQTKDPQQLESMIISLCSRLEQRMVVSGLFCREVSFAIRYRDDTRWDATVKLADAVQDAMEMRSYILKEMADFERGRGTKLLTEKVINLTVTIQRFVSDKVVQYSLFDNRLKKDMLRKVMYKIKDEYDQKNIVRKGSELLNQFVMKDAVGFGSVRDLGDVKGNVRNKHMLEEDKQKGDPWVRKIKQKQPAPPPKEEDPYCDVPPPGMLIDGEEQYLSLASMHKVQKKKAAANNQIDFDAWQQRALSGK